MTVPFNNASAANAVVDKRTRDALRAHRVSFVALDKQWSIQLNTRIKLVTDLLPDGMFIPDRTIEITGTNRTNVEGVYYVAP